MYFGEAINGFDDLLKQKDKFTFSHHGLDALDGEWWEKHAGEINGHRFVAVGFSDYGGDAIDNLVYRKAKEIYEKGGAAAYEEVWNGGRGYGNPYVMGGNAIIFGETADEMCSGKYEIYKVYRPLGDLDDDFSNLNYEFIERNIESIEQDKNIAPLSEEDKRFLFDWLSDHGNMQATYIDYAYDDMQKAIEAFRGKVKDAPGQEHFDFDKGEIDNPDNQPRESVEESGTGNTTLDLSADEVKLLTTFFHEAVLFGDERAKAWEDRFAEILKSYRK